MEFVNATRMEAGYTLGLDPDGRERVIVAVKGTFTIPPPGSEPTLAQEQVPLVMADEFTGEPGFSATRYETDFPPHKPRCDVLLNGSAHAPHGRTAREVGVALRVSAMAKSFNVVGDRVWEEGIAAAGPGAPLPFLRMPISYGRAYGGVDAAQDDPETVRAYRPNPVGVGFYALSRANALVGRPLPNTEEFGDPATNSAGRHRPMSFGPIGRNFASRVPLAGTYDQNWLDNVFPFLPPDFDSRYHQAAPPDQQIDYPVGGEEVEMVNLTPAGRTRFRLPRVEVPVELTDIANRRSPLAAVLDTIVLEPDQGWFLLVWRASLPLKRNLLEMRQCVVGRMPRAWYRARGTGKQYYPSLAHLVAARTAAAEG